MIIASPILNFKRLANSCREIYIRQNNAYESCNGTKPSVKIRVKNAAKAIRIAVAIEIAKSTLV